MCWQIAELYCGNHINVEIALVKMEVEACLVNVTYRGESVYNGQCNEHRTTTFAHRQSPRRQTSVANQRQPHCIWRRQRLYIRSVCLSVSLSVWLAGRRPCSHASRFSSSVFPELAQNTLQTLMPPTSCEKPGGLRSFCDSIKYIAMHWHTLSEHDIIINCQSVTVFTYLFRPILSSIIWFINFVIQRRWCDIIGKTAAWWSVGLIIDALANNRL